MKKLILCAFIFSANFAFAGNPDEDVLIANLRDRFARAHAPEENDLHVNRTWTCNTYDVGEDNQDAQYDQKLAFSKFDGMILYKNALPHKPKADELTPKSFVYTDVGLVSTIPISATPTEEKRVIAYNIVRVDDDGNLITEWAFKIRSDKKLKVDNYTAHGIAYPNTWVTGYSLCARETLR